MSVTQADMDARIKEIEDLRATLEALKTQVTSTDNVETGNALRTIHVDASRAPKIPPIARKNLRNWLFQVDATLRRSGITNDATKFDYLVMALDEDAMTCISHIINSEPSYQVMHLSQLNLALLKLMLHLMRPCVDCLKHRLM